MPMTKQRIFIAGSSEHARVVADVVLSDGRYEIAGLLDPSLNAGTRVGALEVLGADPSIAELALKHNVTGFIVGVGDNRLRLKITQALSDFAPKLNLVSVSHASAVVSSSATIGAGTVVMPCGIINPCAIVGEGCIVNSGAIVEHDCVLNDYAHVGPRAVLGGSCHIGSETFIGIGATVRNGISIGKESLIGAGATVVASLPGNIVAYGVPARVIRSV